MMTRWEKNRLAAIDKLIFSLESSPEDTTYSLEAVSHVHGWRIQRTRRQHIIYEIRRRGRRVYVGRRPGAVIYLLKNWLNEAHREVRPVVYDLDDHALVPEEP